MEQNKQKKIDRILALLSGEIKPDNINPKCVMKIGYSGGNSYLVNGKEVTEEIYDKAVANLEPTAFNITYGEYSNEQIS